MKIVFISSLLILNFYLNAQVGIGTNTPDNSALLEMQSTDKGVLFPRLTSIQRVAINAPLSGLYVFDTDTKSLWYFNGSLWINTVAEASFGDIKSGIQMSDHSGWVLLDGRAFSALSTSQQTVAGFLGLSGNIPNASNAFLVQDSQVLGSVNGDNTVTLNQANLPNVTFTGTAASAGNHDHTTDPAALNTSNAGSHDHTVDPVAVNTNPTGSHDHTVDPSGVNSFDAGSHNHTVDPSSVNTTWGGSHSHTINKALTDVNAFWNINPFGNAGFTTAGSTTTSTAPDHQHAVDIPATTSSNSANHAHWVDIPSTASSTNGNHLHSVDIPSTTSSTTAAHAHSVDIPSTTSSSNGTHTHTVSVSSGGTGVAINKKPKSLTVNMFIYLGL
jgi:hypothetical protein